MFSSVDTPLSSRFPVYTRANVGEVFPDPVAPATRSLETCCSSQAVTRSRRAEDSPTDSGVTVSKWGSRRVG